MKLTRVTGLRYALLACCLFPRVASADDFDNLRLRWRNTMTGGPALDTSVAAVKSALTSIQNSAISNQSSMQKIAARTALWTDIASTTVSADLTTNYSRLRAMSLGYATPGQSQYQNAALLADIISGLDWMQANRYTTASPEYDNWYDWEIGAPLLIVDIGVLLYDQLTADQLTRYLSTVEKYDGDPAIFLLTDGKGRVNTGANLTDKCRVTLLRGVIFKDAAKVTLAVKDLGPAFPYVTTGDGFYADGSFVFHTALAYNGSYGATLMGDVAALLYLLAGSPYDVTDPARANILRWAPDSFIPFLWKGSMMDMIRGRHIAFVTDHAEGHSVLGSLLRLTQSVPTADAAALRNAIKRQMQDDTSTAFSSGIALDLLPAARRLLDDPAIAPAEMPYGSHVYASMDRAQHLRPGWAAGISMHSTRIENYESINGNNLRGWHQGDGQLYLYNGDVTQYLTNYWPTIDSQRLPGTTVVAGSTPRPQQFGGSNAAGGASLDDYSAVMMQLNPDGRQLNAKKSWFLFDDEVVALGADIRSTASGTVETIVDNRKLASAAAAYSADPAGAWANLAGATAASNVGYYFPDGTAFKTLAETRTGAPSDINTGSSTTAVTAPYRTLWFDHGSAPTGAKYSYVLLPGMNAAATAAYAAAPAVRIVQNDVEAQSVTHSALGLRAVNFWSPGKTVNGITSDAVASVLVHEFGGLVTVAVSDPTQANSGTIHVTINTAAAGVVSQDGGVTVDQTTPAIKLSISVKGAAGRSFRVTLRTGAATPATWTLVSGASFAPGFAPESLVTGYGANLAQRLLLSTVSPLPTALDGVSVEVQDSAGNKRNAPLIVISPGQVNFEIPAGTATGPATITARGTPVGPVSANVTVQTVAPALFSANASGKGVAAAFASRVDNRTQAVSPVAVFTCPGACVPAPIAVDANSTVYVTLYGTGIRGSGTVQATCTIHGITVPVLYAGSQLQYEGLDQVNISLPASLAGSGESDLVLTINGQVANTVTLSIQ